MYVREAGNGGISRLVGWLGLAWPGLAWLAVGWPVENLGSEAYSSAGH